MTIEKVVILGIDAIEYSLVEDWDLKYLKQSEYGKTILPLLPGQEPVTVVIWPCFITGKNPRHMGYSMVRVFPQPFQMMIENIYPFFRRFFIDYSASDISNKKMGKQSILNQMSDALFDLKLVHSPSKEDIISSTIFDDEKLSTKHLHIPIYDSDGFPSYRINVPRAVSDKDYQPILEMFCKKEFQKRSKEVIDFLIDGEEYDVFMQYFFLLDAVQHVFFNNQRKIAEFYIMFDEFISKINEMIDDTTLLLIISDHGQKNGIHTPYGYYSVNKNLGLKNPKLIDFRWIIEDLLRRRNEKN